MSGDRTGSLDLVSVAFTTGDPTVQRPHTLLVSEPSDSLFQLDIFEHGRKVLERIEQRGQPTVDEVQRYLNRLRDFDFRALPIEDKQAIAEIANCLFDAGGLDVFVSDPKQDSRLTRITKMRCYATNKRSRLILRFGGLA